MFDTNIHQLFYEPAMQPEGMVMLNEEESAHIIKVLRKKEGDRFHTTDGRGMLYEVEITALQKRNVALRVCSTKTLPNLPDPAIHIAIAPLKQMDRFEWFLEKAVEIGVTSITPVLCKRSERTVLKPERLHKILVAAMKQSQRCYLPFMHEPIAIEKYLQSLAGSQDQKYVGWCGEEAPPYLAKALQKGKAAHMLIGPEGDFTPEEVTKAKAVGFLPVSLGDFRLRTETAGVVALTLMQQIGKE